MPKPKPEYVPPKKKKPTSSIQSLPMGYEPPISVPWKKRKTETDGVISSVQNLPIPPKRRKKRVRKGEIK